jgi:hypothetical protein
MELYTVGLLEQMESQSKLSLVDFPVRIQIQEVEYLTMQ